MILYHNIGQEVILFLRHLNVRNMQNKYIDYIYITYFSMNCGQDFYGADDVTL